MNTEYRCGHCGTSLTEAELDGGICPHCGAQISPFGDVIQPPPKAAQPGDWPQGFLEPPTEAPPLITKLPTQGIHSDPVANQERLDQIRTSRTTGRLAPLTADAPARPPTTGLLLGIGIAIALVLACTIAATGTLLNGLAGATATRATPIAQRHPTPQPTATFSGLGFPTEDPDPTALPIAGDTPTFVPTSTPYGGIPTPTPMPTLAGAPQMVITPLGWLGNCTANHLPTFSITDAGGGQFTWVATPSPGVSLSATTSTVVSGQPPQTVTVTGTPPTQGSIIFTDTTDAGAQPITANFICQPS